MENKLLSLLLYNIDNSIKYELSKDEKEVAKKIIKDFPLILKNEKEYVDFKEDNLDKSIEDICYYNDKIFNADSQTKYPLKKAKAGVINGTISSSILSDDELIDFSGNAALSQYYKAIKQLIVNNGTYLKPEYDSTALNAYAKNIIEKLETWFANCKINSTPKLSKSYTSQILIPKNGTYISISPAHSVGLIAKLIETNRKFSDETFSKRKDLLQELKQTNEQLSKLKKKDFKAKKQSLMPEEEDSKTKKTLEEKIELLKSEIAHLPFIKKASWQTNNTKQYNMCLLAPSSKNGILLSETPSYDYGKASEFLFENDLDAFMNKILERLFSTNEIFIKTLKELQVLFDILFYASHNTNRREKDQMSYLSRKLFKIFLFTINSEKNIKKENFSNDDLREIFINFLNKKNEKPIDSKSIYKIYANLEGVEVCQWQP